MDCLPIKSTDKIKLKHALRSSKLKFIFNFDEVMSKLPKHHISGYIGIIQLGIWLDTLTHARRKVPMTTSASNRSVNWFLPKGLTTLENGSPSDNFAWKMNKGQQILLMLPYI